MAKLIGKLGRRGAKVARGTYQRMKTRILVAEGRRAIRRRAETAAQVARKATKAGLIAGAVVAAGVIRREIGKRRRAR